MDSASAARLAMVYPVLADKITQLFEMAEGESIILGCSQGLRTWAQQEVLFAQGRTTPGKVVTDARGGYSYHNFGLAVDCDVVNKDGSIDWNASHPQWKRMEEIGISLGLTSGATWIRIVDAPHFQLTGRFPVGAPTDELRQIWRDGGNAAVWSAVTASLGGNE